MAVGNLQNAPGFAFAISNQLEAHEVIAIVRDEAGFS
jgi:hypothetical protein